jgi:endonuclease III
MGIDLLAGYEQVERWFVASTLFGTRIATRVAQRTFAQLSGAGINRITDVLSRGWADLVALLDAGGYAHHDERTAVRLHDLARVVLERYGGEVARIGRRFVTPDALVAALDALPGWGAVTIRLFLRELRGVWPGASLPLDPYALGAARRLGLVRGSDLDGDGLTRIVAIARRAGCDERDLEAALVRVSLAQRRTAH